MLETPIKNLSLEEFLKQPETEPANEYIHGEVSQKPMPQGKHSRLQGKLVTAINSVAEPSKIAYAFPVLRCTFGNRSIVPDVVVLEWARIPVDETGEIKNFIDTYPDWIIEILSPAQNQLQVIDKIIHCLENGTRLGWLIVPEAKMILVFPQDKHPRTLVKDAEVLPILDCLTDLRLTLAEVWSWLKI
jgi:Uma2 family endonuclease